MLIKICGIRDPKHAHFAATHGAHFIGMVLSPGYKRSVSQADAKAIAEAARKAGAEPVAVFVSETPEEIAAICKTIGVSMVQYYTPATSLSPELRRFYVGEQDAPVREGKDFVQIEGGKPGCGEKIEDTTVITAKNFFLAGGLTPENVQTMIQKHRPIGVDVSSGVETDGVKDAARILQFIRQANMSFGGIYLPELLMAPIEALNHGWKTYGADVTFNAEFQDILKNYAGRETPLTEVKRFAEAINGPRIFLKREDLLHTGAHKLNNALGQCLLAKKMGKKRIIAETGAGQHGVATATACAYLGLECVVYMGKIDIERQSPNVSRMRLLGAKVVCVEKGTMTLKDAVNEALRDWSSSYEDSHYCLGSALGPHPYPEMVAAFQSVIGTEARAQIHKMIGRDPDQVVACVGGGSNAIGIFSAFIDNFSVELIGVEAGGKGTKLGEHAARFQGGRPGVLHGCYTYLLQNEEGQIVDTHSISAGLDYPAVGPKHSELYKSGRAQYVSATDAEALAAFKLLSQTEGIIPALESSHALAYVMKTAATLPKDHVILINLSGRGEKDLPQLIEKGIL